MSKFEKLPGEFEYRGIYWVKWSSIDIIKRIESPHFQIWDDDVLIATYPRSGTTLLSELVWLIRNGADTSAAADSPVFLRVPFIDESYTHMFRGQTVPQLAINVVAQWPRPRTLKTHLPARHFTNHWHRLHRVLVVIRNPLDTAVSMYHFYRGAVDYGPFHDGWDCFLERWRAGWISGGDWLEVTAEWWRLRNKPGIKVLKYEDLVKRKQLLIPELCEFLGEGPLSVEKVNAIMQHTEFAEMKTNPMTNYAGVVGFETEFEFIRKGQVGDWRNWFSEEQRMNLMQQYEPALRDLGLDFEYD